mgnify:FL=1
MLTKNEREAIAERARECNYIYDNGLYKILFNNSAPTETSLEEDNKAVLARLIDLCDTSNMIELPLDKDGEVIRVGDVVYDEFNDKAVVKSIKYARDENVRVFALNSLTDLVVTYSPNCLTHRYISKAEQLAESITSAIEVFEDKLRELLAYVESLGDDND